MTDYAETVEATPSAEGIAQIIEGGPPQDQTIFAVRMAIHTLSWSVSREKDYPSREALREKLTVLASSIALVRNGMRDFDMMRILRDDDNFILNENETFHGLGDLAQRTAKALSSIPGGSSRHKFYARADGLSLYVLCALMVSLIWAKIKNKWPPQSNKDAQKACAHLWVLAGGPTTGRWNQSSTAVWRDHLRDASGAKNSMEAKHLERFLFEEVVG